MATSIVEVTAGAQVHDTGFVQAREWMLYKIREDHYPLNLLMTFAADRFDGPIFQRTIDTLVEKHEIFRSTLQVIQGELKQVIHDPVDFGVKFEFFDLSGMATAQKEATLRDRKLLLSHMPFNFEFGPLFRVSVFKTESNEFVICWAFHHVIIDSYSAGVFKADAIRIWDSLMRGVENGLSEAPVKYRMYTEFENQLLNTALGKQHKEYWTGQLSREFPRLLLIDPPIWNEYYRRHIGKIAEVRRRMHGLPFYDERFTASVVRRYTYTRAGALHFIFSGKTFTRIGSFRKNSNSSLQALFIAGFLIALHQMTGQELFLFDIPASRRTEGIYKNMIGWLAAGGACYFDLRECHKTQDMLKYIDKQLFQLSKHCIYPFEVLDHHSEVPLGSTMPVFLTLTQSEHGKEGYTGESGIVRHDREGVGICQDMDIYLKVYDDCCTMDLLYMNFLFSPDIIEKVAREQERCLNTILRDILED